MLMSSLSLQGELNFGPNSHIGIPAVPLGLGLCAARLPLPFATAAWPGLEFPCRRLRRAPRPLLNSR